MRSMCDTHVLRLHLPEDSAEARSRCLEQLRHWLAHPRRTGHRQAETPDGRVLVEEHDGVVTVHDAHCRAYLGGVP